MNDFAPVYDYGHYARRWETHDGRGVWHHYLVPHPEPERTALVEGIEQWLERPIVRDNVTDAMRDMWLYGRGEWIVNKPIRTGYMVESR
jgi:hypothetical protein